MGYAKNHIKGARKREHNMTMTQIAILQQHNRLRAVALISLVLFLVTWGAMAWMYTKLPG